MKRILILATVIISIAILMIYGIKGLAGPNSYEDCVLKYIKPSMTPAAVSGVNASCRAKFPQKKEGGPGLFAWVINLSDDQISSIAGRAGILYDNHFGGHLYNGITGTTLSQVTIGIWTETSNVKFYTIDVNIKSLETKDFGVDIVTSNPGEAYHWKIISAKGY